MFSRHTTDADEIEQHCNDAAFLDALGARPIPDPSERR
jgi:hypothetical protein